MIYKDYMPANENVETEVIWSDGPTSEFKNRFMRYLIQQLATKY